MKKKRQWFLRGTDLQEDGRSDPARAQAATGGPDPCDWREAEAALSADLADLVFDQGRLCERVASIGAGAAPLLARAEAASLSWWTADRISAERLALWLAFRIGAAGEDGGGLIRSAWAARRLIAGPMPRTASTAEQILLALGTELTTRQGLSAEVAAALEPLAGLSPVTRGCAAFHLWKRLDERPDHLRGLEAAVLGARIAGARGRGLGILPLSLTSFAALTASGSPESRLAGWITGSHQAVLSALLLLDQRQAWRKRAGGMTADLSGRTPARLLDCLLTHPMIAAPQAEAETGASRAAVQRNLDTLAERGLIREITGQGRFRVWAAKL